MLYNSNLVVLAIVNRREAKYQVVKMVALKTEYVKLFAGPLVSCAMELWVSYSVSHILVLSSIRTLLTLTPWVFIRINCHI